VRLVTRTPWHACSLQAAAISTLQHHPPNSCLPPLHALQDQACKPTCSGLWALRLPSCHACMHECAHILTCCPACVHDCAQVLRARTGEGAWLVRRGGAMGDLELILHAWHTYQIGGPPLGGCRGAELCRRGLTP